MAAKRSCRGEKGLVLEAIPYDKFVRAGVIASKTGMSPKAIGIIIRWNLLPFYVERKEIDDPKPGTYVYKRREIITIEEGNRATIEVSP